MWFVADFILPLHRKISRIMEQIGDMKFVDFEEILERDLGKIGTPKRDEFERKVDETVKKKSSALLNSLRRERDSNPRCLSPRCLSAR